MILKVNKEGRIVARNRGNLARFLYALRKMVNMTKIVLDQRK